jgi:hypothetical protein
MLYLRYLADGSLRDLPAIQHSGVLQIEPDSRVLSGS